MNIPLYILASGNWFTSILYQICERGLPDLFDDHLEIQNISNALQLNEDSLYRILRALEVVGIFKIEKQNNSNILYHTDVSKMLREDHEQTMKWFILMRGSKGQYNTWSNISSTLENGSSSFENINGMKLFQYMSLNKHEQSYFHKAMASISKQTGKELRSYLLDNNPICKLCDIGGGNGELLQVATKDTNIYPILFDTKDVIDISPYEMEKVYGSFFNYEDIPQSDIYILKYILHDWSDSKCIEILNNISKKLSPNGKLIIIEGLLDHEENVYHKLLDIQMMVLLDSGARERTLDEYVVLGNKCNLKLLDVKHMKNQSLSMLIFKHSK